MQKKKNIPNVFAKQVLQNKNKLHYIQFDFITNYFSILKKNIYTLCETEALKQNKLIKLHDFRYKA